MKHYIKISYIFCITLVSIYFLGCKKMDSTYKEYLKTVVYVGKTDSLKVLPGDGRAKLTWLWTTDPKISKLKVYWNNKKDSLVKSISLTNGEKTGELLISTLPEAAYTFEAYTYDNEGNTSVVATASGNVYGAIYKSSLLNRPLKDAKISGANAVINWYSADEKVVKVEVTYTNTNNVQQTVTVMNSDSQTILTNYKSGTTFKYRTIYLPQKDAIDTFPSDYGTKTL